MKKLFALLLAGVMAFGLISCSNTTEPTTENKTMPQNMESMAEPIDALARCMLENNLEYDPHDPDFFWTAMFYFAGGYGLEHSQAAEDDTTYQLILPENAMQEYATALFAEYDGLFDLPEIMEGNVAYHADEGVYFLSRGDIGLSEIRLTSYAETSDGYSLTAELWSTEPEEELICAYHVTLIDNPYADTVEAPLYFYSVKDIVPAEAQPSSATEETAVFNGLADSHTAELTLPDGTVQAFQFDADSEIAKLMGSLQEGDGVTIGYKKAANGSLTIVSLK